jgi:hypothetical protein
MTQLIPRSAYPELKQLVAEASRALATLDADRLEELALSCRALNRDLLPMKAEDRSLLARQARDAAGDMALFGRVLNATRANIKVLRRLRELRTGQFEPEGFEPGRFEPDRFESDPFESGRFDYGDTYWTPTESRHGDD